MTGLVGLAVLATAIAVALLLLIPTQTWVAIPVLTAMGFAVIAQHRAIGPRATLAGVGVVGFASLVIGGVVVTLLALGSMGGAACMPEQCDDTFRNVAALAGLVAIVGGLVGFAYCLRVLIQAWRRERPIQSPDS